MGSNNVELTQSIEYFQKDPVAEPKDRAKGEVVKPRGICSSVTVLKGKSRFKMDKKQKKVLESWYNLYVNYISALFMECIKETQKHENDPTNYAYFSHGTNSKT